MEDLETYFRKDDEKELIEAIKKNTPRFNTIFEVIIDKLIPARNIPLDPENVKVLTTQEVKHKFENILKDQRRDNLKNDGAQS